MPPQDPFAQYAVPSQPQNDPFAAYAVAPTARKPAATEDYLPPPKSFLDNATSFVKNFAATVNPMPALEMLYDAQRGMFGGDVDAALRSGQRLKGMGTAQVEQFKKAKDAYDQGRISEAVGHTVAGALPLMGPAAAGAGEQIGSGDIAGGLGTAAGLVGGVVAPEVIRRAPAVRVGPLAAPRDAAIARAVETGRQMGVPIDAATATQNPFVKFAQKTADESLLGSVVGQRAKAAQQAGLSQMGETLAGRAHPSAVSPQAAGEAAQQGIRDVISARRGEANTAYDALRAIEAQRPMAVDLTAVKQLVKPIADKLAAKKGVTGALVGHEATAAARIDAILSAPDTVPLSVADSALSDIKALARSNNPDLRSVGQGIAAKTVGEFDRAVQDAARGGGADAIKALTEGRTATKAKYAAADILNRVAGKQGTKEAVTAFRGLTSAGDTGVGTLTDVLREAPQAKPLIGRAVLDGLIEQSVERPGSAMTAWQKIGPQTKAALYTPEHLRALDDFFLLSKKIAENPNPSGSGLTILKGGELFLHDPHITLSMPMVSALLHSETGVRLLTRGFRLPSAAPAARAAWVSAVGKALADTGAPMAVPAYAGEPKQ